MNLLKIMAKRQQPKAEEELKLVKNMNKKNGKFFYVVFDKEDNWIAKIFWDGSKWFVDPKNSQLKMSDITMKVEEKMCQHKDNPSLLDPDCKDPKKGILIKGIIYKVFPDNWITRLLWKYLKMKFKHKSIWES